MVTPTQNRRRLPLVAVFVAAAICTLLSACASTGSLARASGKGPAPEIKIAQVVSGADLLYFRGPVPLSYVLEIRNPLQVPVTLRRVTLRTQGRGAYTLNSEALGLKKTIPPGGSEAIQLSTWGRSRGGFLSQSEPVTLLGTAVFDTPDGPVARLFTEYLPQPS
jgi:hypothetical protein